MINFSAEDVRKRILKMANACGRSAHIGGSLSMVEILTVLYRDVMTYDFNNPFWDGRDRFILSKGHCVLALDAVLTEAGLISEEQADTFLLDGSDLGSHPVMNLNYGIESSSGSLGQGISLALGIAKAARLKKEDFHVYALVGNGECNEGSVWETLMLASQWRQSNLTVIVDNNCFQSDGASENIINQTNISERFRSFGLDVFEVDGHNEKELAEAFLAKCETTKVIVANTIKGKGISFMENNNEWHHNRLIDDNYVLALAELEALV